MTQKLTEFLTIANNKKYATQNGTRIHTMLKNIVIDSTCANRGNIDIINQIKQRPNLCKYFAANAQTEVPIAGTINDTFISRRIDRLQIDNTKKTVEFIDYKSDIDKNEFIDKYKKQLNEYAQLLRSAYPNYKIVGHILWLQDWDLQQIISL